MSTLHYLKEYIRYRYKAKTRHGVHSPFIYSFVEDILRDKTPQPGRPLFAVPNHQKLLNKLIRYYKCTSVHYLSKPDCTQAVITQIGISQNNGALITPEWTQPDVRQQPLSAHLFVIDLKDPADWQPTLKKLRSQLSHSSIILVSSIHASNNHTNAWKEIAGSADIPLSLDLFKLGLLFFREEIKEKQHFTLRY